jgi:metal-responsive CopG/Arc/MetJ family transcriptional regulator
MMSAARKKATEAKAKPTIIAFKATPELTKRLDQAVKAGDTDRSKFIRQAVRRALGHPA